MSVTVVVGEVSFGICMFHRVSSQPEHLLPLSLCVSLSLLLSVGFTDSFGDLYFLLMPHYLPYSLGRFGVGRSFPSPHVAKLAVVVSGAQLWSFCLC